MRKVIKQLKLKKIDYYEVHLSIVNCFLPVKLTPMEIKVLAVFMSLEGSITEDRFGTSARKIVKNELSISSAGLSNYFKALTEKEAISENGEGKLEIFPLLIPNPEYQEYMFRLFKEDAD
jgi:hypothetical protein